jgi:hypothetical protein
MVVVFHSNMFPNLLVDVLHVINSILVHKFGHVYIVYRTLIPIPTPIGNYHPLFIVVAINNHMQ